jgi:hypothetical protein
MSNYNGKTFNSKYKHAVAVDYEDLKFLKEIKEKKSAAGKLHEIIEEYRKKHTGQNKMI